MKQTATRERCGCTGSYRVRIEARDAEGALIDSVTTCGDRDCCTDQRAVRRLKPLAHGVLVRVTLAKPTAPSSTGQPDRPVTA